MKVFTKILSVILAVLLTVGEPFGALSGGNYAFALPDGWDPVSGSATFDQQGNALYITTSDQAIINYNGFNIGINELVQFFQPGANSVVLNRVVGVDPSSILGTLRANGQVFLINPNGIFFGPGSMVDTGSFMASTLNITDNDFLSGNYHFGLNGEVPASIVNQGTIQVQPNGFVTLLAPAVSNQGLIVADQGRVALAAGEAATLDFTGTGLISVAIDQAVSGQVMDANGEVIADGVHNSGTIQANGGKVLLTAEAVNGVFQNLINQEGLITANTVSDEGGVVRLVSNSDGIVRVSGAINAQGDDAGEVGGRIEILGEKAGLFNNAVIDASGNAGGGNVVIGGNQAIANESYAADRVYIGSGAQVRADALVSGVGGNVWVWSRLGTQVYGLISVHGVSQGGFVETSGGWFDISMVPDIAASEGIGGLWFIDPANITIVAGGASTNMTEFAANANNATLGVDLITAGLALGNVTISTGGDGTQAGDITLNTDLSYGGATSSMLRFDADNNIIVSGSISSSSGALSLEFLSGASGGTYLANNITTNGGSILFGGSLMVAKSGGVTLTTSGGNVVFNGNVDAGNSYERSAGTNTWAGARAAALAAGGYLATIGSDFENSIVASIGKGDDPVGQAWIGASDTGSEGTWVWMDGPEAGQALSYTNWSSNEPNNSGGNEDYAVVGWNETTQWNDLSGAEGKYYVIEKTLDPTPLTINAGSGNVSFNADVGGTRALGALTISSAGNVTAAGLIKAASITQTAGTGTTTFNGALTTTGAAGIDLNGNIFNINSTVTTTGGGTFSVTNAGLLTIAGAGDMSLDGAFLQDGAGSVTTAGDITTSNDDITFTRAVTLSGAVALNAGAAAITTGSTVTGNYALTLTANDLALSGAIDTGSANINVYRGSNGTISIGGAGGDMVISDTEWDYLRTSGTLTVGNASTTGITVISADTNNTVTGLVALKATAAGGTITFNGGETWFNGSLSAEAADTITVSQRINAELGTLTLTADSMALDAIVSAATNATLTTYTAGRSIGLGNGAGGLSITGAELQNITAADLTIGSSTSGNITVDGVTAANSQNVSGLVTLDATRNGASVTFSGTGSVFNALTVNADNGITSSVDVQTDTGALTFNGDADNAVDGNDTVTLGQDVDLVAATALTVSASTGGINFTTLGTNYLRSSNGGAISLASVVLANNVNLLVGNGTASSITMSSVSGTAGGDASNLTFNTTGTVAVSGAVGTDIGTLTITQSGGTTFSGTVNVGTLTLTDTANGQTVAFDDNLTVDTGMTVAANGAYNVSITGTTNSIAGDTTFLNTGNLTLGNGDTDNIYFVGGLDTTATNRLFGRGTIRTNGAQVDIKDMTVTGGTLTIDTTNGFGAAGADLNIATIAGVGSNLVLTSGMGAVTVSGAVGSAGNALGTIVLQADNAGIAGGVFFDGDVFATALTTFARDYEVQFTENVTITNDTIFSNIGSIMLGNGADDVLTFTGGLDTTSGSGTSLAGTIITVNNNMDLDNVTLTDTTTLNSGGGNITATTITGGGKDLTIAAGTAAGTTTVSGAVTNLGDGTGAALTVANGVTGLVSFQSTLAANSGLSTADGTNIRFNDNVTISGANTATTLNGTVTLDGLTFTSNGQVSFGNGVTDQLTLSGADVTINNTYSGAGDGLTFAGLVDGNVDLILNATDSTVFNAAAGSATAIGDGTGAALTINSTGSTTFFSTLRTANGIASDNGAGLIIFDGDVTITTGETGTTLNNAATWLQGMTFTSAGQVTFGNALTDNLMLTGSDVTINNTYNGAGDGLTFAGTVKGNQDLILNVTDTTVFNAAVGAITIGDGTGAAITINSLGATTFNSTLRTSNGIVSANTAGTITFKDDVSIEGLQTDTTFNNALTVLDGLTFTSIGHLTFGNAGTDQVTLSGGPVTITTASTNKNQVYNAKVDGGQALTLNAGNSGNITANAAIGGTTALASMTITNADDVSLQAATMTGKFIQTAGQGTTTLNGTVTTGDDVDITTGVITFSGTGNIAANSGNSDVTLEAQTGAITGGTSARDILANDLVMDAVTGIGSTGNILLTEVDTLDAINSTSGDIALTNTGDLDVVGTGVRNVNGNVYLTGSADITLTSAVTTTNAEITAYGSIYDDDDAKALDIDTTGTLRIEATTGTIGVALNPIEVRTLGLLTLYAGGVTSGMLSAVIDGTTPDDDVHVLNPLPGFVLFNNRIRGESKEVLTNYYQAVPQNTETADNLTGVFVPTDGFDMGGDLFSAPSDMLTGFGYSGLELGSTLGMVGTLGAPEQVRSWVDVRILGF